MDKTLAYGIPNKIDVLFLYRDQPNKVDVATLDLVWGFKPLNEIFNDSGRYGLIVLVSGEPFVHLRLELTFIWTGKYDTSELLLESVTPNEALDVSV